MKNAPFLALSALLLACPLSAQAERVAEETVTLEFRGGSLDLLIAEIRKAAGGANIVASAMAGEVELPAITLRDATVRSSLMSVRAIVPEPYHVTVDTQVDTGRPVHSVTVAKIQRQTTNVQGGPAGSDRGVRVFSIKGLIAALPSDPEGFSDKLLSATTVLSAVENGLEVSEQKTAASGKNIAGGRQWNLRYHEDSALLFVSGTYEQVSLVNEVLQALERDVTQARTSAHQAGTRQGGSNR